MLALLNSEVIYKANVGSRFKNAMIIGKILGGFFGALFFGVIGGIVGIGIGHLFDQGLHTNLSQQFFGNIAAAQQAFFAATFSVMGHIAKADGRISSEEIQFAEKIISSMGANAALRTEAIRLFTLGKSPNFNLDVTLDQLMHYCKSPTLLQVFVDIQLQTVALDGYSENKQRIIDYICQRLGVLSFRQENFSFYQQYSQQQSQQRQQQRPASNNATDPYQILGMPPTASNAEIKKQYRKLMSQHHPDKLMSQGLPESMVKIATEKTQRIQGAYEAICQMRAM
jgi:DnaJ like chaperone protein